MIIFSRMKLFGLLLVLFVYTIGNAQPPIEWHVDRDSALVHFPMRDSVLFEIEAYSDQIKKKEDTLWLEINELFDMNDDESTAYYAQRYEEIFKKRLELEDYKLQMDDSLRQKTEELNTHMLASFQLQFETFCKLHPEKTIVFEPVNRDCPDWFDLTAPFILFLEEK